VLALIEVMGSALRRRIEDYQKTPAGLTHGTHPHKICPSQKGFLTLAVQHKTEKPGATLAVKNR